MDDKKRKLFAVGLMELFAALLILGDYIYSFVIKGESMSVFVLVGGTLALINAFTIIYQCWKKG